MPQQADHVAVENRPELVRLSKLYDFPDFVKQADIEQTCAPGRLAANQYADPRGPHPQFPCHTAASTWLSCLFYQEKRAEFHTKDRRLIENRLDGYVRYWGIKAAVDAAKARWQELHKSAEEQLPDHLYAYVWASADGHKERRLPLRNAVEVKEAAEWLTTYRDRLPFSDRNKIATRILEKAASYGAAINAHVEFLERQAGRGVCDPREVIDMIEKRALLVDNQELRQHFRKMAAHIKALPQRAFAPGTLVKLAETIDMLDRQQGLAGKYSAGLPRPEDVIFKATLTKAAGDLERVVATTSGKVYEKEALSRLNLADVQALFGDDFAREVQTPLGEIDTEKFAEHASALPRPDAELLDGLLSEAGVAPLLRKAASARQGLTAEERQAWAQAYYHTPTRGLDESHQRECVR